jgi:hypothetical protein
MKAIDYLTKNIAENFLCLVNTEQTWNKFLRAAKLVLTSFNNAYKH